MLKGIDLEIEKGEVVAVIGSSGTGKSTLLRCMNYLEVPDEGSVTIGDITVTAGKASKKEIHELRKHSAMIFQNYNLFSNKDVLGNVTEPLITAKKMKREEAERTAVRYLEKVGMGDKINQYPATLSGGQQQRVAIARALASEAKVLLADEPTGNLDSENGRNIITLLKYLAKEEKRCIIVITHAREIAAQADVIYRMHDGKIEMEG